MDDASLEGSGGRLGTVGYTKFTEDVIDVALYGRFTDIEMPTYLLVALSRDDLLKNFQFPSGQIRSSHPFSQSNSNSFRDLF